MALVRANIQLKIAKNVESVDINIMYPNIQVNPIVTRSVTDIDNLRFVDVLDALEEIYCKTTYSKMFSQTKISTIYN